jgi:myo-inositol catabolism protein IolS
MKHYNRVGLGTFPLASVFNKITKKEAEQLVCEFIESGGYYIHTAPLYGFGEVETLLGKVLKRYNRKDYFISTMCGKKGIEYKAFDKVTNNSEYQNIIDNVNDSLNRLQIDRIDLCFIHSPDPFNPFDKAIDALTKLQSEGKINKLGVSNVNLSELKEYNKSGTISYIQNRYSLINRSIETKFQSYLNKNNIKLIPYQVIDRGQLTANVFEGINNMGTSDLRIGRSDWGSNQLAEISNWVKEYLLPIAKTISVTLEQLSIAWTLTQPYVNFVIVGATNLQHIKANLKADSVKLSSSVMERIEQAYMTLESSILRKYGQSIREFRGLNEKYY